MRTVGLAGLGALGVCFGPVLAIDSPSAREIGQFNWGSTLWHELAHTVTLGRDGGKVPRWFGEGLSVREERRARPGLGRRRDASSSCAPCRRASCCRWATLNNGFVRPTGPDQVAISYYQASLVVEWIEAQRGFPAILELLEAYRDGAHHRAGVRDGARHHAGGLRQGVLRAPRSERFGGRARPSLGRVRGPAQTAGAALFQQKKLAEALPLSRARARRVPRVRRATTARTGTWPAIYKEQGAPTRRRRRSPG